MKNKMNGNKSKFVLLAVFAMLFLVALDSVMAVNFQFNASRLSKSSGAYDIEAMVLKYEPYPVQPGKYFDLWIKIANRGTLDLRDATFELTPMYPFSLYESENATREIGKLGSLQSALVKYRVRVDENAVLGSNPINFRMREHDAIEWKDASFEIYVQPRDLNLVIENIKTEPEKVGPGEKAKVIFTLKNYGDTSAENINLKLDLASTSIPLVPYNSIGEKTLDLLRSGEEKDIVFDVVSLSDAESKIYKVPVVLNYYDSVGKEYTTNNVFALSLAKKPDVYFTAEPGTITGDKTSGSVIVKAVNHGASGIKFLDVTLGQSDGYEILSSNRAYMGKIDSDDYQTAEFTVYLKNLKNSEFSIPIVATYQDSTNQNYEEKLDLKVNLAKTKYVQKSGSSLSTLVIAILVIGAIYLVYRGWNKKRQATKDKN